MSVQNDAYPINTQPSRYHKCACAVNTHGSRMTIKTLHSQLNCTNHDQNLTLVSENQTVYSWQCNKFMFNEVHEYSGEETMLLTWNGELGSTSGKFWVDFQGNFSIKRLDNIFSFTCSIKLSRSTDFAYHSL